MVGMTGEIVFIMLIIGIVCIGGICMGRIKESEAKREEMEQKRQNTGVAQKEVQRTIPQELVKQEVEDRSLEEQRERLLQTEQRVWEIEDKTEYEAFFHKVVMPLQVLLGFSEVSLDSLTEEQMEYYLWEVITNPVLMAVDQAKGKIVNGTLLLSKSEQKFDQEKIKKKINQFGKEELGSYIRENEQRLESGMVVLQKVGVVQGLGSIIEELKRWEQSHIIEKRLVCELAQKVKKLLEENRIYPMFAADERLISYPELKKRYIPINKNSIKYPGLFIERDGILEVFGSNIGMDDCGV